MKRLHSIFFLLLALVASSRILADEGGPHWWWACKQSDLIVRGKVTYDLKRFYQITPPSDQKIGDGYYFLCGTIRIDQVLYANSEGQHSDSFRYYMRSIGKEIAILVPADRIRYVHMKPDDLELEPTRSGAFYSDASIFAVNVIYMYPIGGLVLDSSIPPANENEALRLISRRVHNLGNATTKQ